MQKLFLILSIIVFIPLASLVFHSIFVTDKIHLKFYKQIKSFIRKYIASNEPNED
jgi:hypothetical protein